MLLLAIFIFLISALFYRRKFLRSAHHKHHHDYIDKEVDEKNGHYPSINYKHYNVIKLNLPLSDGEFKFVDIKQGDIGSCWYLSALAAYLRPDKNLHKHQKKLASRICKIKDDIYSVEFKGVNYVVDTYVPKHYIDYSIPKTVLWPILFEKAMLSYETGKCEKMYENYCCRNLNISAGENNYGSLGLELVTEHSVSYGVLHDEISYYIEYIDKKSFKKIWDRGEYILANTNKKTFQDNSKPVQSYNAVKNHCYAVLDVFKKNKTLYIKMYNPWSTKGMTNQECSEHGEFNITWDIFFKTFACIHYTTMYQSDN
jgi:hypothetical protein